VCFATEGKLRTLLWGWGDRPLAGDEVAVLQRLGALLDGRLGRAIGELLDDAEVEATRVRVDRLLRTGRFPRPSGRWPSVPWPPI
jgi:hypothetical protein